MDYLPSPTDPLPGINVQSLDFIPFQSWPEPLSAGSSLVVDNEGNLPETRHHPESGTLVRCEEISSTWDEKFYVYSASCPGCEHNHPVLVPNSYETGMDWVKLRDSRWHSFPRRMGLIDRNGDPILEQPVLRLASLLQSWAFFGLLEMLTKEPISISEWVQPAGLINDPANVRWPSRWAALVSGGSHSEEETHIIPPLRWADSGGVTDVELVWKIVSKINASTLALVPPLANVLLSVQLLCQTITLVRRGFDSSRFRYDQSPFLRQEMLTRGWCRSTVNDLLRHPRGLIMAYYALRLRPLGRRISDHSACGEHACIAHSIAMDGSYRTRHVEDSCKCAKGANGEDDITAFVSINTDTVKQIIRDGRIPLVALERSGDSVSLNVRPARLTESYTVISHVWADGLGNIQGNSLPRCQLLRILRHLESSPQKFGNFGLFKVDNKRGQVLISNPLHRESHLFWMDTLCIPLGSHEDEDARYLKTQAISRMNLIYAGASRVIVMDEQLSTFRLGVSNMLEAQARMALIPWRSRTWTLQEGKLASRCHFECADCVLSPLRHDGFNPLLPSLWSHQIFKPRYFGPLLNAIRPVHVSRHMNCSRSSGQRKSRHITVIEDHMLRLFQTRNLRVLTSAKKDGAFENEKGLIYRSRVDELPGVWNELITRSTSHAEDTLQILTNLLDYSIAELSNIQIQRRIEAILCNLKYLPLALLYNRNRRMDSQRETWMPSQLSTNRLDAKSFMYLHSGSVWVRAEAARKTNLMLLTLPPEAQTRICLELKEGDHVAVELDHVLTTQNRRLCIIFDDQLGTVSENVPGACLNVTDEQYLLLRGSDREQTMFAPWENLLFLLEGHGDKTLHRDTRRFTTTYHCSATISRSPKNARTWAEATLSQGQYELLRYPSTAWKLELKYDTDGTEPSQSLTRRPGLRNPDWTRRGGLSPFSGFLAFYALYLVITRPWRVKLAVEIGWSGTSSLYKASTVLAFLAIYLHFIAIWAAPEVLFLVDRIRNQALTSSGLAWVVVSILLMLLVIALTSAMPIFFAFASYRQWAKSFDDGWVSSRTSSWIHGFTYGLLSPKIEPWRTLHNWSSAAYEMYQPREESILRMLRYVRESILRMLRYVRESIDRGSRHSDSEDHELDGLSAVVKDGIWCIVCSLDINGAFYCCEKCSFNVCPRCLDFGNRCANTTVDHWLCRMEVEDVKASRELGKYTERWPKSKWGPKPCLTVDENGLYLRLGKDGEVVVVWQVPAPAGQE